MFQTKLNLKGAQLTMHSLAQRKLKMHLFHLTLITKEEKYLLRVRPLTTQSFILIKSPLTQLLMPIEIVGMSPERVDSKAKAITKQYNLNLL